MYMYIYIYKGIYVFLHAIREIRVLMFPQVLGHDVFGIWSVVVAGKVLDKYVSIGYLALQVLFSSFGRGCLANKLAQSYPLSKQCSRGFLKQGALRDQRIPCGLPKLFRV